MKLSNPFSFNSRASVTLLVTLTYIALITILIYIQNTLPSLPKSSTPIKGINLTEAWHDLEFLTAQYHPYNSKQNDVVHDWLLNRIDQIVKENDPETNTTYIFNDLTSNLTSSGGSVLNPSGGISVYFEGTNIVAYIRGTADDKAEWWTDIFGKPSNKNAVLVNAHFDSVSTGYGSTDDGVGVVSILQLIKYYTTKGNRPRNGLVALLNNGEEDFLNGARAFGQHPMSKIVGTFMNLEGAGAGGRAALFRSTDEEVTKAYGKSPYPFGTVVTADAFSRGVVRSQTDYVVFNGVFGYRGLDVAFIGPRARYHTSEDDSRHTGKQSLWHMLSAAIATTRDLTSRKAITTDTQSHRSIWFDIFGTEFLVLQSHTFFALSVTLLVAGPILLLITLAILSRADKNYLWSASASIHTANNDEPVYLYGWRGFFRYPFILLLASAAPIALAYLIFQQNEAIIHSSPWPVYAMMVSAFVAVAWFLARFTDYIRPSALTRTYGFGWICFAWWAFLVVYLIHEEQLHIGGGYFTLFFAAAAFLTTFIGYIEMFSLPKKGRFASEKLFGDDASQAGSRPSSSRQQESGIDVAAPPDGEDEGNDATERTSLISRKNTRKPTTYNTAPERTFTRVKTIAKRDSTSHLAELAVIKEQEWSEHMWTFTWLLQLVVIIPVPLIILGQLGLLLVEALHQTGQDGSSVFIVYLGMALVSIFAFSLAVPFLHRFTYHIPMILSFILVGTIIYNLLAFPFSSDNRLKLYFQQQIDLDRGNNTVSLTGLSPYARQAIKDIPSAQGQHIACTSNENRETCRWTGPQPKVVPDYTNPYTKNSSSIFKSWLSYNTSLVSTRRGDHRAQIIVSGRNTRACKLLFDLPVSTVHVVGQSQEDKRMPSVGENGSNEVRLWSRTWNRAWTVDVGWDSEAHGSVLSGRAVCLWSDINQKAIIPAFDEVEHYSPVWVAVTKAGDGLVEGYKLFSIRGNSTNGISSRL